jgi:hypothetical protein
MDEVAQTIERMELLLCGCTLTFPLLCWVVIAALVYTEDLGFGAVEYLVLLFFVLMAILFVSVIGVLSGRDHQRETSERQRLAILARAQTTLEIEASRLRSHNRF